MRFWKGQALGNDYIVVVAADVPPRLHPDAGLDAAVVRGLCDRHRGVGSDGVLLCDPRADPVSLRIYNPDGSEAEKSGNGLRILAAWLVERGVVSGTTFRVALPGEAVTMQVIEGATGERSGQAAGSVRTIQVDMGAASFEPRDVGFNGAVTEVMGLPLDMGDDTLPIHLVSLGNPHCVIFPDTLDPAAFRRLAPRVQGHVAFERGINVQFARVAGPGRLEALIWERGAGETLASGSSASAVAVAAVRSGRAKAGSFVVAMEGGEVGVEVDAGWRVRLTGPAQVVFEGTVPDTVLADWAGRLRS